MMTIKIETEYGVVYPYAPTVVHPMVDRASAEAHVRSTGSTLVVREWQEVVDQPAREHVTGGTPCWCNPTVEHVPAKGRAPRTGQERAMDGAQDGGRVG